MAQHQNTRKIDIHNVAAKYDTALTRLASSEGICEVNRTLIRDFLYACQLGKTIQRSEKKRLGEKRLIKYLFTLRRINEWLGNRDFRSVTDADMEAFIGKLERNALTVDGKPVSYTNWTRRDVKVCVKKFYKWLIGSGDQYPPLVSWIDTHIKDEAPPCLSIDEIGRCIDFSSTIKGKALLGCLFESGARAEEFLNVRICHVEDRQSFFMLRIEHSKTFGRSVPIHDAAEHLRRWLAEHPAKADLTAQLFPMSYAALRKMIARLGRRALGKNVHPHLIRHSYATWLASKKVGRYQMCKLMGWAMSSDMPDRYIDRLGVVEEEAIQSIRGDELTKVGHENVQLRSALGRLEAQQQELQSALLKHQTADEFMSELLSNPDIRDALARKVREKRLGPKLMGL